MPESKEKKTTVTKTATKKTPTASKPSSATTATKTTKKVVSSSKDKKPAESKMTLQQIVTTNAIIIIIGIILVIASVFYLGLTIIERENDILSRLDDIEDRVENVDAIPSRTANLLIRGDETATADAPKVASIENEPVLGDLGTAEVAIIEYSDVNCPFCKRFSTDSLPLIKEEFINNGSVVFVHKDFPSVGGTDSQDTHAVASCVAQVQGDEAYYSFLDELYTLTETAALENSLALASSSQGINEAELRSCLDDQTIRAEIREDLQEANDLGFNGTPSFVIGRITNGSIVRGEEIIGAQPYNVFKEAIDRQLELE
jgi:protein-disulfide isomerase